MTFIGPCSICGAVGVDEWPHEVGGPCPLRVREIEAHIEKLGAERGYWERAQMQQLDSGATLKEAIEVMRKMAGEEQDA